MIKGHLFGSLQLITDRSFGILAHNSNMPVRRRIIYELQLLVWLLRRTWAQGQKALLATHNANTKTMTTVPTSCLLGCCFCWLSLVEWFSQQVSQVDSRRSKSSSSEDLFCLTFDQRQPLLVLFFNILFLRWTTSAHRKIRDLCPNKLTVIFHRACQFGWRDERLSMTRIHNIRRFGLEYFILLHSK